jgi:hypothetical protein
VTFWADRLCLCAVLCASAVSKQDDCEVGAGGARKACKNCSCGRAEAEAKGEKVQLTAEMLENPQSSCGNVSRPGSNQLALWLKFDALHLATVLTVHAFAQE